MIRPATGRHDVDAIARLEQENLGDDAWSPALVGEGVTGELPTVRYLVAEYGGVVVGHAVVSVVGRHLRAAADRRRPRAPAPWRGDRACWTRSSRLAPRDGADRLLLEVREDNAGAIAFYAARGFAEIDRRPRYYRDGGTRRGDAQAPIGASDEPT